MEQIEVFAAQAEVVEGVLRGIQPPQWDQPGLGEWSVAELAAHLVRAADRINAYLDRDLDGDQPACDRVSYFDFDFATAAEGVAQRSKQQAREIGTEHLVDTFAREWRTSAERARALSADHLIQTFRGPMHLAEYTATRVLELTVHHLDLCRALHVAASPDVDAVRTTEEILDGLLDGNRPEGLGDVSWLMVATGREPHDDPRLPVIA